MVILNIPKGREAGVKQGMQNDRKISWGKKLHAFTRSVSLLQGLQQTHKGRQTKSQIYQMQWMPRSPKELK